MNLLVQAKVEQLYRLDRLLQEESGTLQSLQQDKVRYGHSKLSLKLWQYAFLPQRQKELKFPVDEIKEPKVG